MAKQLSENDLLFRKLSSEIKKNNVEAISHYLADGGDPDLTASNGWTLLMNAAWKGHIEIVKLLLDSGAKIDAESSGSYMSALRLAMTGRAKSVRMLLERGADIRVKPLGCKSLLDAMKYAQVPSESVNKLLAEELAKVSPSQ